WAVYAVSPFPEDCRMRRKNGCRLYENRAFVSLLFSQKIEFCCNKCTTEEKSFQVADKIVREKGRDGQKH
ncbi:MAG: hypothetical protein IJE57_05330, partial [Anaerotignum sp.]|nr:hypothetical protein [Anaerotignum sp.]